MHITRLLYFFQEHHTFQETLSRKQCLAAVCVARRKRKALADEYKQMVGDSIQAAVDRDEEHAAAKQRSRRAKVVSALAMQGEANQLRKKLTLEYWKEAVVAKGTTLKGQVP